MNGYTAEIPGGDRQRSGGLPDGPTYSPLRQTVDWYRSPIDFLTANRRRYGPIFSVRLGPLRKAAVVADPAAVRKIFRAPPAEMLMGDANGLLKPVVGRNSLLVLDREEHLRHRRLVAPSLKGGHVAAFEDQIREITERTIYELPTSASLALEPSLDRIGIDVTMGVALGIEDREQRLRITGLFEEMMHRCDSPLALMPQLRHRLAGLSPYARLMSVIAKLDAELHALFEQRARAADLDQRSDALSMMIRRGRAGDAHMGRDELRDEIVTLMMAGSETTTGALAWAVERLAHNPAIQERLLAELDSGETAYLQATIKETLRQRPVVPVLVRKLAVDVELGEFSFPRGWVVMPAIALVHHDPEIYPDPERFDPERFLRPLPEDALWLPFGGGARRCIGAPLAELQMRVVLGAILRRFSLEAGGDSPERARRQRFTLAPAEGAKVVLRERTIRRRRFEPSRETHRETAADAARPRIQG